MIFHEQARNYNTERRRESGSFPVGTGADWQRGHNAAPLRRRKNIPAANAKIFSNSTANILTQISWKVYAKATGDARVAALVV